MRKIQYKKGKICLKIIPYKFALHVMKRFNFHIELEYQLCSKFIRKNIVDFFSQRFLKRKNIKKIVEKERF